MPLQRARNAEIDNDYSSLLWYLCTGQDFFIICLSDGAFYYLFTSQGFYRFCPGRAISYLTENEKMSTKYREQSSLYCGRLPGNCFCIRNAMPLRQIVLIVKKVLNVQIMERSCKRSCKKIV